MPLVPLVSVSLALLVPLVSFGALGVVGASGSLGAPGILGALMPVALIVMKDSMHCHMNSLICRSCIVLLAYALLSVVMYSHNSAMIASPQ